MPEMPHLSRRAALVAAAGGLTAVLTGCGVRLDENAPALPFIPTRGPSSAEIALLAAYGSLATRAESATGDLRTLLPERAEGLRHALEGVGVTAADLDTARRETANPPPLGEEIVALRLGLSDCPIGLLPLTGSLVAASMTESEEMMTLWSVGAEEPREWSDPAPAKPALQATRAALWAATIVVARSAPADRELAQQMVTALSELQTRQITASADDGADAALGYSLDQPASTPEEVTALARTTLERLTASYAQVFSHVDADRTAAFEVSNWLASAQQLAAQWGVPIPPFPGLADPATAPDEPSPTGPSSTSS